MVDKSNSVKLGEWLACRREEAGITLREAAKRAGISEGQWSRIERGLSGTKRSTLPSLLGALRIPSTDPLYAEGYRAAGYSANGTGEQAFKDEFKRERLDADFSDDPVDLIAVQAFFNGLPPPLQKKEYERIRQAYLEYLREQHVYGRRADEVANQAAIDEIYKLADENRTARRGGNGEEEEPAERVG